MKDLIFKIFLYLLCGVFNFLCLFNDNTYGEDMP